MPSWVYNEEIWEKAKKKAAREGQKGNYAYITEIYKKMGGRIMKKAAEDTFTMGELPEIQRLKAVLMKALPAGPKKGKPLSEQKVGGASHKPAKEYREGGASKESDYADPKNWKYPIDTEKHVRAAMSYFAKPENHGMYSADERKSVASRISGAAEKYGIEVSEDWKKTFGLAKAFLPDWQDWLHQKSWRGRLYRADARDGQ